MSKPDRPPAFPAAPAQFFNMVRTHTLQGTFGDPYYGGNANFVGWDLIGYPGIRSERAPSADQALGAKLDARRTSRRTTTTCSQGQALKP